MTDPSAIEVRMDAFRARFLARSELALRTERLRTLDPTARASEHAAIARAVGDAAARDRDDAELFARTHRSLDAAKVLARLSDHPLGDSPHFGDEPLDAFVEALLGTNGRYDGGPSPGDEMIHYDPSPASAALVLARRGWFGEGEVFIDLGSGTGRVVTLGMLLGPARVVGVEIDPKLVAIHRAASDRLGLEPEIRSDDARIAKLDDGTRFFFFAPFLGSVLADVLERLRVIAAERTIHVGSWGPSTSEIAKASFLVADRVEPYGPFDLATFRAGPGLVDHESVEHAMLSR